MSSSNLIMVFDVETTGLITKNNTPHIIQLCYIIYDTELNAVEKTFNRYIKIPESVDISVFITELTGISRYMCDTSGILIEDALVEFCFDYQRCSLFVAHNITFDVKMIGIEMMRNKFKLEDCGIEFGLFLDITSSFKSKKKYCTMLNGVKVCSILDKCGRPKNPKLGELHFKLFKTIPDGLHDALVDTTACLKCYLELLEIFSHNKTHLFGLYNNISSSESKVSL